VEIVAPNPDRDRFIDLVRVTSMVTVVVLHWLSVMPALTAGRVVDQNVVAVVPGLWPLTWTGDVMALFFFAGGYANWVSLTNSLLRGEPYGFFLARRVGRLLRPTFIFLGAWLAVDLLLRAVGLGSWSPLRHVAIGNTIPFGPLWFLGVYLVVVMLSPWTAAAHRRWGIAVPLVMVAGVGVADSQAFCAQQRHPTGGKPASGLVDPPPAGLLLRRRHLTAAVSQGLHGDGGRRLGHAYGAHQSSLLPSQPHQPTLDRFDHGRAHAFTGGRWLVAHRTSAAAAKARRAATHGPRSLADREPGE
jgi:Acyltransferase family